MCYTLLTTTYKTMLPTSLIQLDILLFYVKNNEKLLQLSKKICFEWPNSSTGQFKKYQKIRNNYWLSERNWKDAYLI